MIEKPSVENAMNSVEKEGNNKNASELLAEKIGSDKVKHLEEFLAAHRQFEDFRNEEGKRIPPLMFQKDNPDEYSRIKSGIESMTGDEMRAAVEAVQTIIAENDLQRRSNGLANKDNPEDLKYASDVMRTFKEIADHSKRTIYKNEAAEQEYRERLSE
jgi:hypothetical protein